MRVKPARKRAKILWRVFYQDGRLYRSCRQRWGLGYQVTEGTVPHGMSTRAPRLRLRRWPLVPKV